MRHDRLYDVHWNVTRHVLMAWFTAMDNSKLRRPVDVVMASATVFLLVCERFNLNPRRVLDTADRVIRRARDHQPQYVRGAEEYLRKEVPNDNANNH